VRKFQDVAIYIIIAFFLLFMVVACFSQVKYELPCRKDLLCLSKNIAISQIGTKELTGNNDGPMIEKYLASVGLNPQGKYPYCAAGQYWCFQTACDSLKISRKEIPIKRTALANGIFNDAQKRGKKVAYMPEINDLIFWKVIDKWTGHIEKTIIVGKAGWITAGFNGRDYFQI